MIGPKTPKPTHAEEVAAYELATLRDSARCVKCLRVHPVFGVNRDHRKDRGVGGLTLASNLQLLCGSGTTGCHGWKTGNPREAFEQGYQVPSWADPIVWPARRWVGGRAGALRLGWVLYDDLGGVTEIPEHDALERMGFAEREAA